jgi:hypothetical protein
MNIIFPSSPSPSSSSSSSDTFSCSYSFQKIFHYNLIQRQTIIEKLATQNLCFFKDVFTYFPPSPPTSTNSFSLFVRFIEESFNNFKSSEDCYNALVHKVLLYEKKKLEERKNGDESEEMRLEEKKDGRRDGGDSKEEDEVGRDEEMIKRRKGIIISKFCPVAYDSINIKNHFISKK